MSDVSRLVIAFATFVIVATLTFLASSVATAWAVGNCLGYRSQELTCQLAGNSVLGCCLFPIVGAIAAVIAYFGLPRQSA